VREDEFADPVALAGYVEGVPASVGVA